MVATVKSNGDVQVSWTRSTDNVGVVAYLVFRNAVQKARVTGTSALLTGLGRGTHYLQVQAVDAAGNLSRRTASVVVTIA